MEEQEELPKVNDNQRDFLNSAIECYKKATQESLVFANTNFISPQSKITIYPVFKADPNLPSKDKEKSNSRSPSRKTSLRSIKAGSAKGKNSKATPKSSAKKQLAGDNKSTSKKSMKEDNEKSGLLEGQVAKPQFSYNETTFQFNTMVEKEIRSIQKRYTYEAMFREDMDKFKEKTFDWRIEIRSNFHDIKNRIDILRPYTYLRENDYPIEFVKIDENFKLVLAPGLIFNYLNHPFRDMLSSSFIIIQEFYDYLQKYFFICHLVNDSIHYQKIEPDKIQILDPWAREKIRNYNKVMLEEKYILDEEINLFDIIRVLLKFYFPVVSKNLVNSKIGQTIVLSMKQLSKTLELGLFKCRQLIQFFPLLTEISQKQTSMENYFADNLNGAYSDVTKERNIRTREDLLDPNGEKTIFDNHIELPEILKNCRIEMAKILIQIHVQLQDQAVVDQVVSSSNYEKAKIEAENAVNKKEDKKDAPEDEEDDEKATKKKTKKKVVEKSKELEDQEREELAKKEAEELAKRLAAIPPEKQLDWSQFSFPTNTSFRLGILPQLQQEYMKTLDITYNYLGRDTVLMGMRLYSPELNVYMASLMMLNMGLNYNPFYISCELTGQFCIDNYDGPSKEATFEEAFQFKIRDDFNKFVYDLRNGNYGKFNLIYCEDFQEKVKNVCSSFRFKHALMDQHKQTFDLCTLGTPLNILAILDFIIPENYNPTPRTNDVVYYFIDMLISICKNNSYGKGVITKGQHLFYLKRICNKIELEVIVLLYYVYMEDCLVLNFNEDFQDFILERYVILWREAYEIVLKATMEKKADQKDRLGRQDVKPETADDDGNYQLLSDHAWKVQIQDDQSDFGSLLEQMPTAGGNINLLNAIPTQMTQNKGMTMVGNDFPLDNQGNNLIPFQKAGTDISKIKPETKETPKPKKKEKQFVSLKNKWTRDKIVTLECLNFVVRRMLLHERIKEAEKCSMQEKKQVHYDQGLMENRGRYSFWLKFQNVWKNQIISFISEDTNESEKQINIFDVIIGTIRDKNTVLKQQGSIRSFDSNPPPITFFNKYFSELFSEDAIESQHALYLTRKNDDPRNRGRRKPDDDSLLFELMCITMENINLSVENYISEELCTQLREKMNLHERYFNDYSYLNDFKEGIVLKKEVLKMYSVLDTFSQNFVITDRIRMFKDWSNPATSNRNWFEVRLPRGLVKKFPSNLKKEVEALPEICKQWEPVEDEPFTTVELDWIIDYLLNGILKLVYMYCQFVWAFYDNTDDKKQVEASDHLTEIYESLNKHKESLEFLFETAKIENCKTILEEIFDKEYVKYAGMNYDDARTALETDLEATNLELVEKNNPSLYILRTKAYLLANKIVKLYKDLNRYEILEKYSVKTNMRGHCICYDDFNKIIDIDFSSNLAKYATTYKAIIKTKRDHKHNQEFKGRMFDVHKDLVQYMKYDFQINLMARTKISPVIKIQNYAYKFIISESQFNPENFLNMIIREFVRPYTENRHNLNEAFTVWLSKPHLLSYIVALDNFLVLDPNLRDKVYKFFADENVCGTLRQEFFTWIYYVIFTLYQFCLNKIYFDKEWGIMYSKFMLCTGLIISLLQNNNVMKEMLQDVVPDFDDGPVYQNPKKQNFITVFYGHFFIEFDRSCSLTVNLDEMLLANDEPKKLIIICRIFELLTEFANGPCELNQNALIEMKILPLLLIIFRNVKHIDSIFYSLQYKVLLYIIALMEGCNQKSVKEFEKITDPKLIMESMFTHFKKLYIYMMINKGADSSKHTMVEESLILSFQDPAFQKSMTKLLDMPEKLKRACLDSMNREYEISGPAKGGKKIGKSKLPKASDGSNASDLIGNVIGYVKKKIIEQGTHKQIPNALENCIDRVIKLSHQQDFWLLDESFLAGTMMYKMGLLYYQIQLAPADNGKRFVPYLENKVNQALKAMKNTSTGPKKKKPKKKKDNAEEEESTRINPDDIILYFVQQSRKQIELVSRSGIHQKITFFNNPRCLFIFDDTKKKFEARYAIEDSASKMTSLLKEWLIWSIEINFNYLYRVKSYSTYIFTHNDSFRMLLKSTNFLNTIQNAVMLLDFERDLYTNIIQAKTPIILMMATILSVLIIIQSSIGLVAWIMIRQPPIFLQRIEYYKLQNRTNTEFKMTTKLRTKILMLDCLLFKRVPQNLIWHLVTSLMGFTVTPYAYAVGFLCTFNINDEANTIMRSFTLKMDQIGVTLMLIFIAMFNYSMVLGDYYSYTDYYPEMFNGEAICNTMKECFMIVSNEGQRLGGGISDAMYIVDINNSGYFGRWFFSVSFFLLVNLIGLQITLGSIIDAFSFMRDLRNEREFDKRDNCFVCGLTRGEFEQNAKKSFDKHTQEEHNKWTYIDYIIYLEKLLPAERTAFEKYIIRKKKCFEIDWIPQGDSVYYGVEGEAKEEDKIAEITSKLERIEEKITELNDSVQWIDNLEEMVKRKFNVDDLASLNKK